MASSIGWTARSEYEHELGAPVAVPLVCRRCLLLNVELLLYKHISRASIKQSVDGFDVVRLSNASRKVCSPLSLSILGNMLTTSNYTRIDEFRIIDAMLNWGARFENRGSDISLKLRRNIA